MNEESPLQLIHITCSYGQSARLSSSVGDALWFNRKFFHGKEKEESFIKERVVKAFGRS